MPDIVLTALRQHKARQAEERLLAGPNWNDLDLVFATGKGTPIEPRRLNKEFKRILEKAALSRTVRLHDSRHFAASLLVARGVHPRTAMEILGHNDMKITMLVYSHVDLKSKQDAAEEIDAAFGGR